MDICAGDRTRLRGAARCSPARPHPIVHSRFDVRDCRLESRLQMPAAVSRRSGAIKLKPIPHEHQSAGPPERLAKRTAAALDRNAPPAELSQSCAIHSPLLLRPIANTGMASFRIALSGRLTLSGAAGLSSAGNMSINFNLHPSMCAQSRMKSRVSSAHLHKCKIKTAAPGCSEIAKDDVRHLFMSLLCERSGLRLEFLRADTHTAWVRACGGAHESTEPGIDRCASPAPPRSPRIVVRGARVMITLARARYSLEMKAPPESAPRTFS